jgi:2-amino-4-hydroxy-6-hydroxymethyldihydropteridine diphosphokinase
LSAIAYVALGSNLGDREAHLRGAIAALEGLGDARVLRVSRFHRTKPVGGPPGQRDYLNAVCALSWRGTPQSLIVALHAIEAQHGRVRHERWAPRTLDLDLLLFGDVVLEGEDLQVPHPRMHQRRFVLEPLVEIAPDAWHPVMRKTAAELLAALPA